MIRSSSSLLFTSLLLAACGPAAPERALGSASQASVVCPGPDTVEGIDVSVYDGTVDWAAVAASGRGFALARLGQGTTADPSFATHWAGMKAEGLVRGAYLEFRPALDATAQANLVSSAVGALQPGDLPVALWVEAMDGVDKATLVSRLQSLADAVEASTGRKPIIGTGKSVWASVNSAEFATYPLWIPSYSRPCPDLPDQWSEWLLFQYSDSGTVPGLAAGVARVDRFNGSLAVLRDFALLDQDAGLPAADAALPEDASASAEDAAFIGADDTGPGTPEDAAVAGPDARTIDGDAGPAADGASVAVDASAPAPADAGPTPDAAQPARDAAAADAASPTAASGGCGCAAGPGSSLGSLLAALPMTLLRRRRRVPFATASRSSRA
ncbi:MAG: GH25 family lysozyme [Myxococcales bacterium]